MVSFPSLRFSCTSNSVTLAYIEWFLFQRIAHCVDCPLHRRIAGGKLQLLPYLFYCDVWSRIDTVAYICFILCCQSRLSATLPVFRFCSASRYTVHLLTEYAFAIPSASWIASYPSASNSRASLCSILSSPPSVIPPLSIIGAFFDDCYSIQCKTNIQFKKEIFESVIKNPRKYMLLSIEGWW